MDWGFVTINSNEKFEQLTGLNGESSFLVVVDHKLDHGWGHASGNKEPYIEWLSNLLTEIAPE